MNDYNTYREKDGKHFVHNRYRICLCAIKCRSLQLKWMYMIVLFQSIAYLIRPLQLKCCLTRPLQCYDWKYYRE